MDSDHLYALTGVVIHSGTVHAGHYHVFLKDFMREGQWRRKDVETDDETKVEETEKDPEALKKKAFLKAVCDDAVWYDFNDSTVKRMSSGHEVAAQYGGPRQRESAYML